MQKRDYEVGGWGSGLGKLFWIGMLIVFSTAAYVPPLNGESPGGRLRINVRIQNYAHVEPNILSEAIREATAILHATGVEFT